MVSSKGKEKVGAGDKGGAGKRKIDLTGGKDDDKTGKRKRNDVLQFFEDSAFEVGDDEYSDDSDFFDTDFIDDEFGTDDGVQKQHEKAPVFPLVPKEEEMDEEELEKMLRERYKAGSSFVKFAEDGYEKKGSIQEDISVPSTKDPTIWKVKCMVGRERHSAFCLMQKYVDLRVLGMKLQIISAFALDHVKGFVYIEADKQSDVNEACKGLCSIYSSRMSPVPRNEISQLISVRSKCNGISEGMWARVKSGKYKGDLAQVVAVNDVQKKVTVKLIPRIDLQALAEKFGGGVVAKKASIPAPRLIRSTELEDFRPLITIRKDRETNQMVEVLDGKMLREGYLFKKVSIDSLCFWGVMPSETELLKFEPYKNDEPQDTEWLSQLYGERKRKRTIKHDKGNGKGGEKGEGSSNSANGNNFEVDDLVFFGRKDFGIIIGTEKENVYKIMKEGSEGPVLVTVQLRELRAACFDRKLFTVKDQHKNTISINDIVRVLDGPSKDRQGIVKQIYKGVIFLYDEMGEEHNRYVCVKAPVCERISRSHGLLSGKESEAGPSTGFAETPSSPNTPLSPKKPCRERGDNSNFSRGDKDGLLFSVGQSVRIRVGPLKGYICRVLAVRQSDVTVKLDSRQKILTVKSEHLSEVHGRSSTISLGSADPEAAKPFDLLGAQDGSTDWTSGGVPASAQDENWNAGLPSNERSAWPSFPASSCLTFDATELDATELDSTELDAAELDAAAESAYVEMAQSGGKNDTGNEPNASYSDANLTDDETQPVDSQCFAKGGDVKGEEAHNWLMMQNTLPVDNLLQCTDGFETQPINLYAETQVLELYDDTQVVEISGETQVVEIGGDTQVVYDHDGVEYIHTQLLDECNSEVATDSDCEGSDRTEILYETQEISDDDLKDNAKSMSCLNLQNTSLVEEADSGYKVRSDALNKEKHHSGPLHGGFTSIRIASMRASGLAAQSMAQIRTTGDSNKSNSSLELLTTKQDVPFVSRDFSNVEREVSKAHGWEDNAKHSKDVGNESRCKLGSSAVRRLFTEDTSDEIEKPEDGNNHVENGADLPQMFDSENALAGLSYLDSQEPGDESQANALEIVDRFLKFNAVECDQDIDLGKSVEKSVSVPSAKGTKSLAQRATRSTHEVGGIFDWDDNREDEGGGDFFQKNKDLLFDKKSSTVPRKPRCVDTDCVGKVEHPDSCKKKKDFSRSNSRVKSNIMRLNNESENPKSRNIFVKELNKQLIDMYDNGVADNKTANDVPDIPDVGLDTQMAAEAMQSLCFGGSLIEHQSITADLQNGSSKSGANNERQLRQSSSKKRIRSTRPATRQSLKTERAVATSVKSSENSKKQCDGELLETKRTRSNVRLQHAQKINRTEELKEESANRASNTDDFDRSLGAPSNGCRSLKKRPFHEQLGSLTPVAHRTRRRIVTNNQKCTGNTSDSSPEEINDLHSASTSDKSLPDDDARKTSTKDEFVTKLGNMDSAMFKSDQMAHPKGIRSRRTRASIARENYNQSNTRSSRTITNGSAPVYLSLRKRRRLTEENLMHKYSENGHAEDPNITDAADDIGGASIPNDVVNAKASKNCTRKSIMQGRKSVDAIKENGVEASPKDQSKTSASPSTTPINCMTPRNEASPICMGDEYRKRSCRRSMSGSSLIREINSLHTVGLPTASSVKDSRRRREMTNVRVLFSRHLDLDITKHQKKILTRLGASLASSMSDATHFVTDEFVRTRNILEAIAFGKPVVTHLWLESCAQACCLIDEKNYILRDAKKEREFGFSMPISLARASQHPLLQGHRVFITPNTKPGTEILAGLVKAVHGLPIERCGRSAMKDVTLADDILVLSCEDDYDLCVPFLEKGKTIYSSELLLNGIVTQKLEYERYQLFTDHFKKTRSTVWMKKNNNQNCPVTKSKS